MIVGITNIDLSQRQLGEIPDFGWLQPVEVDAVGLTPDLPPGTRPVFYSGIEWLGPVEPLSAGIGLGIFSDLVFFNGLTADFKSCFARYRSDASLTGIGGLYLMPDTLLLMDGNRLVAQGSGGVILFRPMRGRNLGLASDLSQYDSGHAFTLELAPLRIPASDYSPEKPGT